MILERSNVSLLACSLFFFAGLQLLPSQELPRYLSAPSVNMLHGLFNHVAFDWHARISIAGIFNQKDRNWYSNIQNELTYCALQSFYSQALNQHSFVWLFFFGVFSSFWKHLKAKGSDFDSWHICRGLHGPWQQQGKKKRTIPLDPWVGKLQKRQSKYLPKVM